MDKQYKREIELQEERIKLLRNKKQKDIEEIKSKADKEIKRCGERILDYKTFILQNKKSKL